MNCCKSNILFQYLNQNNKKVYKCGVCERVYLIRPHQDIIKQIKKSQK